MIKACYINEFRPLAQTPAGRAAIAHARLPPFIDASCRREPDLQSKYPSITALCREEHFAPRLREGDVVAYLTKDFAYPPKAQSTRRLVAVLRIQKSWQPPEGKPGTVAHEQAAEWYQQQRVTPPSNCMVKGSHPLPLELTDRYRENLRDWEAHYWRVARSHGVFHACEPIFFDVNDPPRIMTRQLFQWFGRIPSPWDTAPLDPAAFAKLLNWLAEKIPAPENRSLQALIKSLFPQPFTGNL